jgi:hypothetical protein
VSADFTPFFEAMAGGGAALMGVLFVAASFQAERMADPVEKPEQESMADACLMALFDGFMLSAVALIPGFNPGAAALPLSALGLVAFTLVAMRVFARPPCGGWPHRLKALAPTIAGLIVLGSQVYFGIRLLQKPGDAGLMRALALVVLAAYSIGLVRAWMLLGGARHGLRAALEDLEKKPPDALPAPPTRAAQPPPSRP